MKRAISFFIILGLAIFFLSGCRGSSSEGAMFRANLAHTGVYEGRGVPSLHGPRWEFKADSIVHSSPAVADGIVYFGSGDHYLYALDVKTGKLLWRFKAEHAVGSSPALANGTIYFGSTDCHLYALE